jgi:general secretion pathway protein H
MISVNAKAGFTLLEMMAVMMLIALMASIATTSIPGSGRTALKAVVMNSVALLRRERLAAMMTGKDHHVSLDGEQRILMGDGGEEVAIPKDVAVEIVGTDESWAGRVAVALFHPDGASSGSTLKFSREGLVYEIDVNWYTGGVAIKTP